MYSLLLILTFLCLLLLFSVYTDFAEPVNTAIYSKMTNPTIYKHIYFINNTDTTDNIWQCSLPVYDPWDKEILEYFEPRRNIEAKCNKNFTMLTELKDMRIYKKKESLHCWGRCLNRGTEYVNDYGDWKTIDPNNGTLFECDVVETSCSESSRRFESFYAMVHYQAVPVKPREGEEIVEVNGKKYSVHVILVDSLSTSQADRALPKTMRYLEKSMKAITFPYLNKVGLNSRPNGVAMWFGKQMESINRTLFGLPSIPIDWDDSICQQYLDNETSLFSTFREYGYKTMLAEDWMRGCINYPNCKGFLNQPTDHYLRPMQIELGTGSQLLKSIHTLMNCFAGHRYLLDYLDKFISAYPEDQPLFSWLWVIDLGHNNDNDVIRGDTDFLEWFIKMRDKLDNSFVIFTGDHGFRLGKITRTHLGTMDNNNPLLTIILPKELRNNTKLINTMKDNSQKLITHYDTRATILDILKYQPLTNFTSHETLQMEGEKGNSLFRKMDGERSCRTLPIPLQYCLCEYPKEQIDTKSELALELGQKVVELTNFRLAQNNVSDKCAVWEFEKVTSLSGYKPHLETGAYTISVTTTRDHVAVFMTQLIKDQDGKYTMTSIERGDRYQHRGDCVNDHLSPICDCLEISNNVNT